MSALTEFWTSTIWPLIAPIWPLIVIVAQSLLLLVLLLVILLIITARAARFTRRDSWILAAAGTPAFQPPLKSSIV